ncbi:hypothetical protein [Casimicrobium huifangae]|uniref:hypothetical protein n=1 Tax=Casimicrobium huifangae TaxID=2591109 RepID=UPI0037841B5F
MDTSETFADYWVTVGSRATRLFRYVLLVRAASEGEAKSKAIQYVKGIRNTNEELYVISIEEMDGE